MSPTAVKDNLSLHEPTSKPNGDLYECASNACNSPEQDKDGVIEQTDLGPPKSQKEHLSPTVDVTPDRKYAKCSWDASREMVDGRLS